MRSKDTPARWRVVGRSGGEDQLWREGRMRLKILRVRLRVDAEEDEGDKSQPQVEENQDLRPDEAAEGVDVVELGVIAEVRVSE